MTAPTRPIGDLDVPLSVLTLRLAAARSASPSDRIAYALDEWLVTHPKACSTDADYPGWADQLTNPTAKEAS